MDARGAEATLPPDENQGTMLLASVLPFFCLAVIVYAARIWSRVYPKYNMTAADYTITVAMISKTISIGFMIGAIQHGFGRHNAYIPKDSYGVIFSYLLGVFMTGVLVSSFARVSIACVLLRITTGRVWRAIIWVTLVVQVLFALSYEIVQLVQCQSVIANKLRIPGSQCLTKAQVWAFTYVSICICMISDLVCAAISVFTIWRLSRSNVEKTLVIILMASCLLATACGIPKLYYMVTYDFSSSDGLWLLVPEFLWCRMEEATIIIAACAPLLKGPIEKTLRRMGLPTFSTPAGGLNRISTTAFGSDKSASSWPMDEQRHRVIPSDLEDMAAMTTATRTSGIIGHDSESEK